MVTVGATIIPQKELFQNYNLSIVLENLTGKISLTADRFFSNLTEIIFFADEKFFRYNNKDRL